jgi:hypothetical protein
MEPLTPEQRDQITRVFGPAIVELAEDPPKVCRTPDEIAAAAARDGLQGPPVSQATADRVAAILAPHLDRMALAAAEWEEKRRRKLEGATHLTEADLAERWYVEEATVAALRLQGRLPACEPLAGYRVADILAWEEAHLMPGG